LKDLVIGRGTSAPGNRERHAGRGLRPSENLQLREDVPASMRRTHQEAPRRLVMVLSPGRASRWTFGPCGRLPPGEVEGRNAARRLAGATGEGRKRPHQGGWHARSGHVPFVGRSEVLARPRAGQRLGSVPDADGAAGLMFLRAWGHVAPDANGATAWQHVRPESQERDTEPHERQRAFGLAGRQGSKPSRGVKPRGRNVPGEANPG